MEFAQGFDVGHTFHVQYLGSKISWANPVGQKYINRSDNPSPGQGKATDFPDIRKSDFREQRNLIFQIFSFQKLENWFFPVTSKVA